MAVIDMQRARGGLKPVRSFESHLEAPRIRLTSEEADTINYVLVGWESDVGLGSNFGAMATAIANQSNPDDKAACAEHARLRPSKDAGKVLLTAFRDTTRRCLACRQTVESWKGHRGGQYVCVLHAEEQPAENAPKSAVTEFEHTVSECNECRLGKAIGRGGALVAPHARVAAYDANEMTSIEKWCDRPTGQREKILRCWRTLVAMARERDESAVVLCALYGDMPPALPSAGVWQKAVDVEYRRIVRYADGGPGQKFAAILGFDGSGATLDRVLGFDRHRRERETDLTFRARVAAAELGRRALVVELARRCEALIVLATVRYRNAWRAEA